MQVQIKTNLWVQRKTRKLFFFCVIQWKRTKVLEPTSFTPLRKNRPPLPKGPRGRTNFYHEITGVPRFIVTVLVRPAAPGAHHYPIENVQGFPAVFGHRRDGDGAITAQGGPSQAAGAAPSSKLTWRTPSGRA